jgi:hypothetical protein
VSTFEPSVMFCVCTTGTTPAAETTGMLLYSAPKGTPAWDAILHCAAWLVVSVSVAV